jgi:cytochrome c peroxidase
MGRINESDNAEDAYRFRTPSLRNVTLTAPYGHNGAYKNLRGIIKHHLNPKQALKNWQSNNLQLPKFQQAGTTDFVIQQDQQELNRLYQSIDITNQNLSEKQIDYLVAFLSSLTDQSSLPGRLGIPETVPSGLTVPR